MRCQLGRRQAQLRGPRFRHSSGSWQYSCRLVTQSISFLAAEYQLTSFLAVESLVFIATSVNQGRSSQLSISRRSFVRSYVCPFVRSFVRSIDAVCFRSSAEINEEELRSSVTDVHGQIECSAISQENEAEERRSLRGEKV